MVISGVHEPDPAIAAAVDRRNRVLRKASRRAFVEQEEARDDQLAPVDAVLAKRRRDAEAVTSTIPPW
ncbi:hypothetical protein Sros01_67910 [Streptomyces roseochromogenus]|nr:hypothetical protein Sros01_67910 [Streptomyces roseochromogenus]